jgi:hypothetical protein
MIRRAIQIQQWLACWGMIRRAIQIQLRLACCGMFRQIQQWLACCGMFLRASYSKHSSGWHAAACFYDTISMPRHLAFSCWEGVPLAYFQVLPTLIQLYLPLLPLRSESWCLGGWYVLGVRLLTEASSATALPPKLPKRRK